MSTEQKIAVIGGGVAAVATVVALRVRGIPCVAFAKEDGPGGLWRSNYPGAKNQTGGEMYEFPDKALPAAWQEENVPASEVKKYLEDFIKEQDCAECFRFGVEVSKVTREAEDRWILHFADDTKEIFSYLIVCTGLYSSSPNIIDLPGREAFEASGGTIIHTSQRKNDKELKGKNVVVVGNGRSAIEAARAAGKVASDTYGAPPVQLVRHAQWYFPKYIIGLAHLKNAFLCRFGAAMLPRYYFDDTFLWKLFHVVILPLKFVFWRMIETIFIMQNRLPRHMNPKPGTLVEESFAPTALAVTEDDLDSYRTGEVEQRVATIKRLEARKVILDNGDILPCDLLVLGTGWKTSELGCLDNETIRPLLDLEEDGLWLYRHILPPIVKGLAFVGRAHTFTNPQTMYIQACWLADLLAGYREWPSLATKLENVKKEKYFKRKYYPETQQRGNSIFAFLLHYNDLLMRDMGIDPYRFGGLLGGFCNWMLPVVPSHYREVLLYPDTRNEVPKLHAPLPLYALTGAAIASVIYNVLA